VQVEPTLGFARLGAAQEPVFLAGGGRQPVSGGSGQSGQRQNILSAGLGLRLGLPLDTQLTLGIPYNYVETSTVSRAASGELRDHGRNVTGFGDFVVSLSKQLLREGDWRPDLVTEVNWNTDTGQTERGVHLGTGFDEVTAGLTASKSQDPLVFVGGLSYTHAFGQGGVEPGDVYGLSLGAALGASPETSLRFFFDQSFVERTEAHGRGVAGSDAWVGQLSIGASSVLSRRVLLDAELGIGLTSDAPDYVFRIALPIRFDLPLSWAPAARR
jgi:hypothetical protein